MKTSVEWSIEMNRCLEINGVAKDPGFCYQSKSEDKAF